MTKKLGKNKRSHVKVIITFFNVIHVVRINHLLHIKIHQEKIN